MNAQLSIERWAAHTAMDLAIHSGSEGILLEQDRAKDVSFLPALSRRRLSGLSRLSLRLAYECVDNYQGFCVFGSQHGEILTTQKLLESIVGGELVSPAGFSSSVHNTAVGLHSINNHNEFPCTSIAAGLDTLTMCFIEAYALIASGACDRVLVVYADDQIPEGLARYLHEANQMRGFAALVTAAKEGASISIQAHDKQEADGSYCQVGQLARALADINKTSTFAISGERVDWRWQVNGK